MQNIPGVSTSKLATGWTLRYQGRAEKDLTFSQAVVAARLNPSTREAEADTLECCQMKHPDSMYTTRLAGIRVQPLRFMMQPASWDFQEGVTHNPLTYQKSCNIGTLGSVDEDGIFFYLLAKRKPLKEEGRKEEGREEERRDNRRTKLYPAEQTSDEQTLDEQTPGEQTPAEQTTGEQTSAEQTSGLAMVEVPPESLGATKKLQVQTVTAVFSDQGREENTVFGGEIRTAYSLFLDPRMSGVSSPRVQDKTSPIILWIEADLTTSSYVISSFIFASPCSHSDPTSPICFCQDTRTTSKGLYHKSHL
ncbi:hypothetical protein U0070_002957 [Myodes glareolus]|uniref:Uncharacterized protein n=1 Tax=Myodes glareolus TaxID=447135 RepID=A0AAW0I7J0_MYOGA